MTRITDDTPSINAKFAATALNRAAELIADPVTRAELDGSVIGALQQAKNEFIAAETHRQKSGRTYGWSWLRKDLGEYIQSRYPTYAASFTPISDWNDETSPGSMAQTLREAAVTIAGLVAERTSAAGKFEAMTPQERAEYELMRNVAAFLDRQGLTITVAWDRENPNDPIDYRGTVDGVAWAFELIELRIDAKGSHLTVGHPKERKRIPEQIKELAAPMPQIPDGPDALQKALDAAVSHGNKMSKLNALNGARYCLVLHNRQFLYAPDWEAIAMPDLSAFDAVLILHQDSVAAAQTWEAATQDGFNKALLSQNVSDLSDIASLKLSGRPDVNPEVIRSFWKRMDESGITDEEIYEAVKEARAERCRSHG